MAGKLWGAGHPGKCIHVPGCHVTASQPSGLVASASMDSTNLGAKLFLFFICLLLLLKVTQSCLTLCDPMVYTVHGILQARILEWVAFPFSRVLPNPGIEPRSPALQADSLPAEPPRSPRILEWIAYPFSSGSSQPRKQTGVSCTAGRFFTS